ncbi:MAG: RAMP superfamily CRISPR-associated protein, partial [Pseudanabaena sp.]
MEWLNFEHWNRNLSESRTKISPISIVLGAIPNDNKRDRFTITAKFSLIGSMLIRSGQSLQKAEDGKYKKSPDDVHLKSYRPTDKNPIPVISGTSLAGVLRHRSVRIIKTLEKDLQIVDDIFGTDISDNGNKEAKASRLIVHESEIKESSELVQSRIAIDRFTGGAMHGALF